MTAAMIRRSVLGALFLVLMMGTVHAQFNSSPNSFNLNWNDPENLQVQIFFAPNMGNFQQQGGAATPTTNDMTVQVNYSGMVNRQSLTLYAYFADPARALGNATGAVIPAADIQATIQGVGTSRFTNSSPFSPASVTLNTTASVATNGTGNLPATFSLSIMGTNYSSGQYQGTLFIQAQAI